MLSLDLSLTVRIVLKVLSTVSMLVRGIEINHLKLRAII